MLNGSDCIHVVSLLNDEIADQNEDIFREWRLWFKYETSGSQDTILFGDTVLYDSEEDTDLRNADELRKFVISSLNKMLKQLNKIKF